MFTGIVTGLGRVTAHTPIGDGQRISVACGDWNLSDVAIGDSIAHSGCCLTIVEKSAGLLKSDVSAHSLSIIAGLHVGALVNLEKSMTLADKLGGHLVTGHVDATGKVTVWKNIAESWLLEIEAPAEIAKFIAQKGSITVNGVSLTVNRVTDVVNGVRFQINVIPHTYQVTNFCELAEGARVNLEIDTIARYVERMTQFQRG
ncbi:MAG: riboflavin synthase [Betaproteobacteria bacterium]|nr:MAG: riboflavin synthase [Betaproteobacteria bacterium]